MPLQRIVLIVLVTLSCAEPSAPPRLVNGMPHEIAQAVIGTWNLASWNAKPVPAKYETYYRFDPEKEIPCTVPPFSSCPPDGKPIKGGFVEDFIVSIESSTVTLNDDATYQRTVVWLTEYTDGRPTTRATEDRTGGYTGSVAGGSVVLDLFGGVRMQMAGNGNAMSAKLVVGEAPPVVLGDVWLYRK